MGYVSRSWRKKIYASPFTMGIQDEFFIQNLTLEKLINFENFIAYLRY